MFVRKGTVRKSRRGGNRPTPRRPRRNSNENVNAARRQVVQDEATSSGSASCRLTPNDEYNAIRSTSALSLSYGATSGEPTARYSAGCPTTKHTVSFPSSNCQLKYEDHVVKASPARSQTATVVVSAILWKTKA